MSTKLKWKRDQSGVSHARLAVGALAVYEDEGYRYRALGHDSVFAYDSREAAQKAAEREAEVCLELALGQLRDSVTFEGAVWRNT